MGYAGGVAPSPTYHRIGDHSEAFQLDFDPAQISYEQLLTLVWQGHSPTSTSWSRQYRPAIFFHDAEQQRAATTSAVKHARALGIAREKIVTPIEALTSFTRAEDYHQKHDLQGQPRLATELRRYYPRMRDFVDSTAAARLNGYLARRGSKTQLLAELDALGLSARGRSLLLSLRG